METAFKQGYEKILSIFYNDKNAKIHLREIARKAKLNENSASRFLQKLEKAKILNSMKDGNLKKYRMLKNDLVYSVLSNFDISRLNSLPSIRKNAMLYFLDSLEEQPIIALLFGSMAKNIFTERSDIDVLLVVNRKISTKKAAEHADSQTAIRVNALQISIKEFKEEIILKNDKVVQSAINTGYPITNHIQYYRMVCNERIWF